MRFLFYTLLFANLVYLGWSQVQPDPVPPAPPPLPADLPSLVLLSELPEVPSDPHPRADEDRQSFLPSRPETAHLAERGDAPGESEIGQEPRPVSRPERVADRPAGPEAGEDMAIETAVIPPEPPEPADAEPDKIETPSVLGVPPDASGDGATPNPDDRSWEHSVIEEVPVLPTDASDTTPGGLVPPDPGVQPVPVAGAAAHGGEAVEKVPRAQAPVSGSAGSTQGTGCYSVGPWSEQASADALRDRLRHRGFSAVVRSQQVQEPGYFWVYLPSQPSLEAAERLIGELVARGVEDHYVIRDGSRRNAVSLGLYAREGGARQRERELRAAGFAPTVGIRYRNAVHYWLDIREPDGATLSAEDWQISAAPVRLIERACE